MSNFLLSGNIPFPYEFNPTVKPKRSTTNGAFSKYQYTNFMTVNNNPFFIGNDIIINPPIPDPIPDPIPPNPPIPITDLNTILERLDALESVGQKFEYIYDNAESLNNETDVSNPLYHIRVYHLPDNSTIKVTTDMLTPDVILSKMTGSILQQPLYKRTILNLDSSIDVTYY